MQIKEQELLSYACETFEAGEYERALEAFVLAYGRGYEPEWVLKNIYNCYMSGNEETFRESYECQASEKPVSYEDCLLDFVPYRDEEYYVFDKESCVFRGVFSVPKMQKAEPDEGFARMEFSDAALVLDWDFREAESILTEAKERKIYIICHDIKRCLSFWKIPELKEYVKNIRLFSDFEEFQAFFHENTSVYLPRVFSGNEEECRRLFEIREEEHRYRLTPEGRNTENVLLTIAIPTANRGNLLLERLEHLLVMPYDAEIEIAVSKNGDRLYEEEYKKAGEIKDARLHYHDHGGYLEKNYYNWHYAVEMSCGKYVMTISDEDDVFIGALEHYLKLLGSYPDLSLVRPKNTDNYAHIRERQYGKKGWDAFDVMFLTQNHFPGMIVRRKDFVEANLLELEKYADNYYYKYYPHEWWYLMLCRRGDCMMEPVTLNDDSHPTDVGKEWNALGLSEDFVPGWKTYESRIRQFQGQVEFLYTVMKIDDKEKLEKYLGHAISRVTYLFNVTRRSFDDSELFARMVDEMASVCVKTIEEASLDNFQKERLLKTLGAYCKECFEWDEELRAERQGGLIS